VIIIIERHNKPQTSLGVSLKVMDYVMHEYSKKKYITLTIYILM